MSSTLCVTTHLATATTCANPSESLSPVRTIKSLFFAFSSVAQARRVSAKCVDIVLSLAVKSMTMGMFAEGKSLRFSKIRVEVKSHVRPSKRRLNKALLMQLPTFLLTISSLNPHSLINAIVII